MVSTATKRARKGNHRKAAPKDGGRAGGGGGSLAARVRLAAQLPIRHCVLFGDLQCSGMASLVLARGADGHRLTFGGFLIDSWGLGVKETFLRNTDDEGFARLRAMAPPEGGARDLDPAQARRLLRDVTAWAQADGIAPHRDFTTIEQLFGDVDADACTTPITFGQGVGAPVYVEGRPLPVGRVVVAPRGKTGAP